jgi:hypothetical protein
MPEQSAEAAIKKQTLDPLSHCDNATHHRAVRRKSCASRRTIVLRDGVPETELSCLIGVAACMYIPNLVENGSVLVVLPRLKSRVRTLERMLCSVQTAFLVVIHWYTFMQ